MIDQINELPEDGLKSSPETSCFTENKWINRENQNKLYFLHLIDSDIQIENTHKDSSTTRSNHKPVLTTINTFQKSPGCC